MISASQKKVAVARTWSLYGIEKRSLPRGAEESLKRAIEELGPLNLKHDSKLLSLCSCSNCVENSIVNLAAAFNKHEIAIKGAPRKKEMANRLQRVASASQILADELVGLDNLSRKLLRQLDPLDWVIPIVDRYRAVVADELPEPDTPKDKGRNGALVDRLVALAGHAEMCVDNAVRRGPGGSDIDRVGRTNFVRERLGPSAAFLVVRCWAIFRNCQSTRPKASENGSFNRFLNAVHELATGDIDENSTLLNWAKRSAKLLRKHDELLALLSSVEYQLDCLSAEPRSNKSEHLHAELECTVSKLKDDVVEAFLAINASIARARKRTISPC